MIEVKHCKKIGSVLSRDFSLARCVDLLHKKLQYGDDGSVVHESVLFSVPPGTIFDGV